MNVETETDRPLILTGDRGIKLASMEDAYRFAQYVVASRLAPKNLDTPEKILIAIQTGMEAGLTPMHSLQAVVVINGLPSWKGDGALSIVKASGEMKGKTLKKIYSGSPMTDGWTCTVLSHRVGADDPTSHNFSVADAKRAGLWATSGQSAWAKYPERMLYYRALGFHLRDVYPDVLNGLAITEEVQDYPRQAFAAPVNGDKVEHQADPLLTVEPAGVSSGTPEAGASIDAPGDSDTVTDADLDELFSGGGESKSSP